MTSWKRTGRDMTRIFFTHNQHIAVVMGKKPRRCTEIELVDITQNPKVPILSVQCRCKNINDHAYDSGFDSYCLVNPIIAGPPRPYVTVLHRDGSELVKVEMIQTAVAPGQPSVRALPIESESESIGAKEILGSAIGFSQNYSLDEAFKDAVQKLRLTPVPASHVEPSMIDVVSMGAVYGGFSGYSRLFVRVEQSSVMGTSGEKPTKIAPRREKTSLSQKRSRRV